jgi:voltage-gated potassium channel
MDVAPRLQRERWRLLHETIRLLEWPMAALGVVWLVLLVVDLTRGLQAPLADVNQAIWIVFVLDFLLELAVAPRKLLYVRKHWLAALALAAPVLRVLRLLRLLRVARLARVGRGVRLLRTVSSLNRAIRSLRATMRRRGLAYVTLMTMLVTFGGAAGMYSFEQEVPDPGGIHDYGTALWWTAMLMTTMGSAYWPQTMEGRILCVLLALYAFAVFGYVTALLASYFVGRDAAAGQHVTGDGR